ncbi:hypothetical protein HPP92_024657 [Vanilla planifolia]|uniref:Uncharacterized protein n=1 Tax=Vanilla planifolia TaxID=51239 RepID=A0A835PSI2_VANPL|nr:hypothetical protein HPP92_024657 [Vanilla planifolia]
MSNMNYLVHKMPLEQSRSLPTPYWPVKDLPDIVSSANFVNGYPTPHSKFPQMGEISHHMLQSSNHKELPSILHPTADKSPPVAISTAALPNLHEVQTLKYSHGSMDINKNTMDMNQSQQSINSHIGFGTPQSLQTKPQPSLSNLAQLGDFSGGVIAPEKFVTSEFTQDPQITHLLQQQYMLYQQLHSQVPLPAQNVSPLDLLLLMQRQKHEQQQKQFLLQQQQHLLSQVLSANQLQQLVNEVPLMHLRSGVNTEITTPDNLPLQKFQEELQSKLQIPAYGSEDSYKSGFINLSLHGAQDGSFTSSSEHSQSHLQNQIIEHISQQNLGDANGGRNQNLNSIQSALTGERLPNQLNSPNQIFEPIPQRILTVANDESAQNSHAKRSVLLEECLPSAGEGSVEEAFLAQKNALDKESYVASEGASHPTEIVTSAAAHENILMLSERNTAIHDSASSICQNINDANVLVSPDTLSKEAHVQKSAQKATKGTELQEVKNASEKKSRKQKNSQIRAVTDQVKESSKASHERSRAKLDTKEAIDNKKEQEKPVVVVKTTQGITVEAGPKNPAPEDLESSNFVGAQVSTSGVCLGKKLEVEDRKFQGGGVNVVSVANVVLSPNNLAWKPAQGQRAKSLLEIQQEEQQKVQIQSSSNNIPEIMPMNDSVPPVASNTGNSVQKYVGDTLQDVSSTTSVALNPENLLDSINMIGNSHNILLEDFSAKSSGARDITGNHENGSLLSSPQNVSAQTGLVVADDDDFVEAKDTRRIRRSRKNKGVVVKASKSLTADDSSNLPSISGKTTPTKVGLDEEFFPVPAVPSLGDFVFWKGDQSIQFQLLPGLLIL